MEGQMYDEESTHLYVIITILVNEGNFMGFLMTATCTRYSL